MRRENFIFILCLFCSTSITYYCYFGSKSRGYLGNCSPVLYCCFFASQTKTTCSFTHTVTTNVLVSKNTSVVPQCSLVSTLPPRSQAHFLSVFASLGPLHGALQLVPFTCVAVNQLNEFKLGAEEMMNFSGEPTCQCIHLYM